MPKTYTRWFHRLMKEREKGKHPFGDTWQLISLGVFVVVCDSFFLRHSTFLLNYVPLYVLLVILGLSIAYHRGVSLCVRHIAVSHEQRLTAW